MSNVNYRDYVLNLAAGVPQEKEIAGDYWQVVQASADVTLEFDQGTRVTRGAGCGGPARYGRVRISSAVDQTVKLAFGSTGGLTPYDSRGVFSGTVTVNPAPITVQQPLTDVAVPAGGGAPTLLAAELATRRELVIKWPSSAVGSLRVGDSTTGATKGAELEPGDSITISGTAAMYGYNTGAAPASASLLQGLAS